MVSSTMSRSRCPENSGRVGSSTNIGRKGSSSRSTRRAIGTLRRPWKSRAKSPSGPIASRTAAAVATMRSIARDVSSGAIRPLALSLTAVKPASRMARAWSATSAGSSPPIHE